MNSFNWGRSAAEDDHKVEMVAIAVDGFVLTGAVGLGAGVGLGDGFGRDGAGWLDLFLGVGGGGADEVAAFAADRGGGERVGGYGSGRFFADVWYLWLAAIQE